MDNDAHICHHSIVPRTLMPSLRLTASTCRSVVVSDISKSIHASVLQTSSALQSEMVLFQLLCLERVGRRTTDVAGGVKGLVRKFRTRGLSSFAILSNPCLRENLLA